MKKLFAKLKNYLEELGKLTPLALITTFLPMVGSATLLIFGIPLGYWLRENWEIGMPLYLFGVLFFCGLALLPTNVIGMIGGWAFSFELGIAILITGVVGAAVISFFIHRRIVGEKLPEVFEKHPKAQAIYEALLEQNPWRTTLIIFLLRISVIMPFAFTNFLMASARVPLGSYTVGTFFGMLPRSSAVVFVGAGLSELSFDNPQDFWVILGGIAATVISAIIIAKISKHALDRRTSKNQTA
jgi:uncharacterized membrane protein YdjX (TVP38/TMEM64 family)